MHDANETDIWLKTSLLFKAFGGKAPRAFQLRFLDEMLGGSYT